MSVRVDPGLRHEVAEFGDGDTDACMNCGNCTAEGHSPKGNSRRRSAGAL